MQKIRKLETKNVETVVELWYQTSIIAHDFISASYWKKNKDAMASIYLPNSETYVAIEDENIIGFISMVENLLAAIFVDNELQGKGTGKKLLNFIKKRRIKIQLKAYMKNTKTVDFYKSQDFKTISKNKEKETGEYEYLMEWTKE
ncbi:GNAT family N-acetyltransferase [Labilibaculum sp. 44]|uniref:GNAT family N-acetyltransferase n=1 Tax=Labilibaculum euxinus TaxID=2686357 RepID=A0A7M4DAX7_9BACT|nr:GNAT family N-acetyltransferase [Labilibaculum euxinus]MVB09011.1 GNAT family N-acetyltransferase [Labilibaculum euxinus]